MNGENKMKNIFTAFFIIFFSNFIYSQCIYFTIDSCLQNSKIENIKSIFSIDSSDIFHYNFDKQGRFIEQYNFFQSNKIPILQKKYLDGNLIETTKYFDNSIHISSNISFNIFLMDTSRLSNYNKFENVNLFFLDSNNRILRSIFIKNGQLYNTYYYYMNLMELADINFAYDSTNSIFIINREEVFGDATFQIKEKFSKGSLFYRKVYSGGKLLTEIYFNNNLIESKYLFVYDEHDLLISTVNSFFIDKKNNIEQIIELREYNDNYQISNIIIDYETFYEGANSYFIRVHADFIYNNNLLTNIFIYEYNLFEKKPNEPTDIITLSYEFW